jgi:hypothetical protein
MAVAVVAAAITGDQEARRMIMASLAAAAAAGLPIVTPRVLLWSLLGYGRERLQVAQTTNRLNGTLGQVNGFLFSFSRSLHLIIYLFLLLLFSSFFFSFCEAPWIYRTTQSILVSRVLSLAMMLQLMAVVN